MEQNIFSNFTHLYPVQKTLRFALDNPVGDSLINLKQDFDEKRETFKKDQAIQDAYQILKPEIDTIHKFFITKSLESNEAKSIDFTEYWNLYEEKMQRNKEEKSNKKDIHKTIETLEEELRKKIVDTFKQGGKALKKEYPSVVWKKGSNKNVTGVSMLTCEAVLEVVGKDNAGDQAIQDALSTFKRFFTALSGFNENRKNYYTSEEKNTAIANRIVGENLPKYCANRYAFNKDRERFLGAFDVLKQANKTLQDKEGNPLSQIEDTIFQIEHFVYCLSQSEIEEYNKKIGNANYIANLYNQHHSQDKGFKKLPKFKILFKQIGCGQRDPLFFKLTHDTKQEATENIEQISNPYSVEQVLHDAKEAGEQYFKEVNSAYVDEIHTVYDFTRWLTRRSENNDWEGVYWSKAAITHISNTYFDNWHDILEKVKNIKTIASFDEKREEQIKIHDAVALTDLFAVFDSYSNNGDWINTFFKSSIVEERIESIDKRLSASQNLIHLICEDIKHNAKAFLEGHKDGDEEKNISSIDTVIKNISKLKNEKEKENYTQEIKSCMDCALGVCRTIKNFKVKESKIKGAPINGELEAGLEVLLNHNLLKDKEDSNWFKWYDALRNHVTKRYYDDANKLRLYFDVPTAGSGWDKNKETANLCTIFLKGNTYYLGIVHKQHNDIFKNIDIETIKKTIEEENRKKDKKTAELGSKKNTTTQTYKNLEKDINTCNQKIDELRDMLSCLQDHTSSYKKMVYKFFKDGTTMIPKCSTQLNKVQEHFKNNASNYILDDTEDFVKPLPITKEIFDLNNLVYDASDNDNKWKSDIKKNHETRPKKFQTKYLEITKDKKGYTDALKTWIAFCKDFLESYRSAVEAEYDYGDCFNQEYENLSEFYQELKSKIYKITFEDISESYINRCIAENKLYLFEIYSKDFSEKSKGNKNLQTYYWQEVLKEQSHHQLNGGAEVFYRKKIISYDESKMKRGHHYEQQKKHCEERKKDFFPIIKDKRYTKERFSFHCPITLNYAASMSPTPKYALSTFNAHVHDEYVAKDVCFLGLDRGEKHLVYYSIVNAHGHLIDQGSLNVDLKDKDGNIKPIKKTKYFWNVSKQKWDPKEVECSNYNDLLDCAASYRDYARKNWQAIGKIKYLKEGYVSQVVHEISNIVFDKIRKNIPIFVVLEDLSTGFKRGRQAIEKQIYQKFEQALAKKLNFMVDKSKQGNELGSPINALQLTPPVLNYGDIENKKQVGIMFYTRANYTSQTDPRTGWRKTIYLKKDKEEEIKKKILDAFDDFGFDGKDYYFEYTAQQTERRWRLWSGKNGQGLTRYRGKRSKDKNVWITKPFDIPKQLDKIFERFDKTRSFKAQILDEDTLLNKIDEKNTAWESLRFVIDLIQQIRNSGGSESSKEDDNFLQSPVRDTNGEHYDSRKPKHHEPDNADANGAFNIARKGLIMQAHIEDWEHKRIDKDLNLFVSDEEWDLWTTDNKKWQEKLPTFASQKNMEEYRL